MRRKAYILATLVAGLIALGAVAPLQAAFGADRHGNNGPTRRAVASAHHRAGVAASTATAVDTVGTATPTLTATTTGTPATGTSVASATELAPAALTDALGIRYETPTTPPLIAQDTVLHSAATMMPAMASGATQTVSQYVLFSVDVYYRTDSAGQKHYVYQGVPAWVISFEGLTIQRHGCYTACSSQKSGNHEMNVVIDATTGQEMETFSYR